MAAPFDAESLRLTGAAVPVFDGVLGTVFAGAQYSISRNGSFAYIPGELQAMNRAMLWVNRNGTSEPLGAPLRPYMDPRLSPDGKEVVATIHDGVKEDIWVYHLDRCTLTRLTYDGFENETPLWTPSGDKIVLCSSRVGPPMSVFRRSKDGSGTEELLFPCDHHVHLNSISPDEQVLIFTDYDPIRGGDIWQAGLAGDTPHRALLQRPFNEWGAHLSPNGRWLTYVSNESGRDEIYVVSFPALDRKWQVSVDGGTEPLWARSGLELFYRNADTMMAVTVTTDPAFSAGKPVRLFEGGYDRGLTLGHTNYDVASDAQSFLMLQADAQEAVPTRVNVVLNWFDDLKWRNV
jgi:serine/threonine-protein kinase